MVLDWLTLVCFNGDLFSRGLIGIVGFLNPQDWCHLYILANVYNGLNCIFLTSYVEALIPNVTVFEMGLWEVIRLRWGHEGGPSWWYQCPYKTRHQGDCFHYLSVCHMRSQQESSYLQARKRALTRNWICWHLEVWTSQLQNSEE